MRVVCVHKRRTRVMFLYMYIYIYYFYLNRIIGRRRENGRSRSVPASSARVNGIAAAELFTDQLAYVSQFRRT